MGERMTPRRVRRWTAKLAVYQYPDGRVFLHVAGEPDPEKLRGALLVAARLPLDGPGSWPVADAEAERKEAA
jgi:hypothetical protein